MATIPLPALGIHVPQQESPLDTYSKFAQLKSLQNQQQIQQQQITAGGQENQMRAQQLRDQQAMTQAMQEWDGRDSSTLIPLVIKHGASAQSVFALRQQALNQQKTLSEMAKNDAETGSKNIETLQHRYDMTNGALNTVLQAPDEQFGQSLMSTAQQLAENKIIDPQHLQIAQQIAQMPPAQGRQALGLMQKSLMSETQQLAKAKDEAGLAASAAQLPGQIAESNRKQRVLAGTNDQGVTAEQQAQLAQGKQRIGLEAAGQAETRRHNQATEAQLTPEGIDMAANQFATTGQMPQMGRDAKSRAQIINRAAQLYPGVDLASNAAAYHANTDSLKKLQTQKDAVSAFENTANKNLDLFVQQAQKVVDSGSPWVNQPMRSVQMNALGNNDLAAFNAARQVAINEVAKVTSNPGLSGTLSDSARHEIESFNPASATLAQTLSVAKVLKQDMANRHQAYDEQIAAIQGRLKNSRTGAAAPAKGAAPGVWGNIPGAVQHP